MPAEPVVEPVPVAPPAWRVWARRLGPWIIATVVVAAILRSYSAAAIAEEMARGQVIWLVPIALVMLVLGLFAVAIADWLVLGATIGRLRFVDVVRGKAGSALLDVVSYAVGHGSYAVWIARKAGAPPVVAGGALLYIITSDLTAVCLVASLSLWLGDVAGHETMRVVAPCLGGALLMLKIVGAGGRFGGRVGILRAWALMSAPRVLAQIGARMSLHGLFIVATWAAIVSFGIDIPLAVIATYVPLLLIVASLPVNIAGFGAVQGVWLLLTPWAPGERILAFQVLWHLAVTIAVVVRGLPFVRGLVAEVAEGRRTQAAERAAALREG